MFTSIVGYIRVYGTNELSCNKLKEHIHGFINELDINFELTLEVTN